MTIESAIVTLLRTFTPLSALVATRVYLDKLPQTPTYPCVRVTLIDEQEGYHVRGGTAVKTSRVQVDAFAKELSGVDPYALAAAVADAIHGDEAGSGLSGYQGSFGSPAIEIQGVFRMDRRRYYDPDELRVLTMSQDYQVAYRA